MFYRILFFIFKFFGKICGSKVDEQTVFIFHSYNIGGAELVHLNIIKTLSYSPLVYFINSSPSQGFLNEYRKVSNVHISKFSRGLLKYAEAGYMLGRINKSKCRKIFGISNVLYYEMINSLKSNIQAIDILHAFNVVDIAPSKVYEKLSYRIVIDKLTEIELKKKYYNENNEDLISRIRYIPNMIDAPLKYQKDYEKNLVILFVGRDTYEKRVKLIVEAAKRLEKINENIHFVFIGPNANNYSNATNNCIFLGEITDRDLIKNKYKEAHILVMASSREGMPLVIMEGMSNGVVPITTNAGGIPYVINDKQNGFLICDKEDHNIVSQIIKNISHLDSNRETLKQISKNCQQYVQKFHSEECFIKAYMQLLN